MPQMSARTQSLKPSLISTFFQEAKILEKSGVDIINLGVGEVHHGFHEKIKLAIVEAVLQDKNRYTPTKGDAEFIKTIHRNLIAKGHHYEPANIIVSAGSKPFIGAFLFNLINPGDKVLIPSPYYPAYEIVTSCLGGEPILVDTLSDRFQLTAKNIRATLANIGVTKATDKNCPKLIIINPVNNPTGAVYSRDNLKEVAKLAKEFDLWVIVDMCYEGLIYLDNYSCIDCFDEIRNNCFYLSTFSKDFAMAGLRLGYAVGGNVDVMKQISLFLDVFLGCANSISQHVGSKVLHCSKITKDILNDLKRNKEKCSEWLKSLKLSFVEPEGGLYFFVDFSEIIDELGDRLNITNGMDLATIILKEKSVVVTPGVAFGSKYNNYLRISYSVKIVELERALKMMKDLFRR